MVKNYGNYALLCDTKKVNNESKQAMTLYKEIEAALMESDDTAYSIIQDEFLDLDEYGQIAKKKILDYQELVGEKFSLEIEALYLDENAEGTELTEKILFSVNFDLPDQVNKYSSGFETWSTCA